MELRDVIRATKVVADWGKWQKTKMPPRAFPLSRKRGGSYRLSQKYTWRVVLFDAGGRNFRLLIAFRADIESYEALLGEINGNDTRVIASYEFHGTHAGWHLHANCEPIDMLGTGFQKSGRERRIPKSRGFHRQTVFGVDESNGLSVASEIFGLPADPGSTVEPPRQGDFGL